MSANYSLTIPLVTDENTFYEMQILFSSRKKSELINKFTRRLSEIII